MIVFAFPPQAADESAPYWLDGTDYVTKTAGGTLVVVPPGCRAPADAGAPVFCMDGSPGGTLVCEQSPDAATSDAVWISSRVSGGTLRERLQLALAQYGPRLWLYLEPVCMRFPMPCPTGEGEPLPPEENPALQSHCAAFYSPEFCCMYHVRLDDAGASMYLADTPRTILEKLALASSLGVSHVFGQIPPDVPGGVPADAGTDICLP